MKPLLYLFIAIAILAYGSIKFDQVMGWEDERAYQESRICHQEWPGVDFNTYYLGKNK